MDPLPVQLQPPRPHLQRLHQLCHLLRPGGPLQNDGQTHIEKLALVGSSIVILYINQIQQITKVLFLLSFCPEASCGSNVTRQTTATGKMKKTLNAAEFGGEEFEMQDLK